MRTPQPTAKQKAFADNYLRTRHITNSAVAVYNTKSRRNAHKIGNAMLRSPKVQSYIAEVLDQSGLTDEVITEQLKKIIKASTTRHALKKTNPADGLRGLEIVLKLKDRFPAEKKHIKKEEIKLSLKGKTPEQLQEMLNKTIEDAKQFKQVMSNQ